MSKYSSNLSFTENVKEHAGKGDKFIEYSEGINVLGWLITMGVLLIILWGLWIIMGLALQDAMSILPVISVGSGIKALAEDGIESAVDKGVNNGFVRGGGCALILVLLFAVLCVLPFFYIGG